VAENNELLSLFGPEWSWLSQSYLPYIQSKLAKLIDEQFPYLQSTLKATDVTPPYKELTEWYPGIDLANMSETGIEHFLAGTSPPVEGTAFPAYNSALFSLASQNPEAVALHELVHTALENDTNLKRWQQYLRQMPLTGRQDRVLGHSGYPTNTGKTISALYGQSFVIPPEMEGIPGEEIGIRRLLQYIDPEAASGFGMGSLMDYAETPEDKEIIERQKHIVNGLAEFLKYGPTVGDFR